MTILEPVRAPRIYVPNKTYHDFSPATTFGDLIFLTSGSQERLKLSRVCKDCLEKMKGAKATDYLLIAGPTTLNVIAAAILARRFGRINFLIYDHRSGKYQSRVLMLDQIQQLVGETHDG